MIIFSCDVSLIMFDLSSNFQGKPKGKQKEKGWQLFRAKDFQSLMYPCFIFCRILGIYPYKINASTFEASKPYYILSTVITCVCSIYALIILFKSPLFGEIDMLELVKILGYDCNFVFGGFTMIVTLVLSDPRMQVLQIILKISSRLPSESYEKLSKLIHAKDIIGFFYLVGNVTYLKFHITYFFRLYIYLVVFQMDMMYMNCICVLKICFKRINDNLLHMREVMTNDDLPDSSLIYHKQRNSFLIMKLITMRKEHLMTSNTIQMLNIIFNLQLLATVIMTFFDLTIHLFYYILHLQHYTFSNNWDKILFNVYFFLFLAYIFIKIVLIVWACETVKNQALQISTSIHDVFNSTTDKQIKNEVIYKIIYMRI